MAMIGLRVPQDLARLLQGVEVPGEPIQRHHQHVTIHMLGDDVPIEQIGKAIIAAHGVAEKTVPFRLSINSVSTFKGGDHGVPVICPVFSPELHELWENLKTAFDEAGVEYSKKWPEYKPHVTLSYSPEPMKDKPVGPVEWSAFEMVLWGGDSDDQRLCVTLPFSLPGKTAMWRNLIRASIQMGAEPVGYGTPGGWEHRKEREEMVERNIEALAPHLKLLWRKMRNQFRGTPDRRYEQFLEYVEEHPGEDMALLEDDAEKALKKLIRDREKLDRAEEEERKRLEKAEVKRQKELLDRLNSQPRPKWDGPVPFAASKGGRHGD